MIINFHLIKFIIYIFILIMKNREFILGFFLKLNKMIFINLTIYHRVIIFLSFLLFLISYLFQNLIFSFAGLSILIFLIYTKNSFKNKIGKIIVNREILEKQIFVNHIVHVKPSIENIGGNKHF